MLGGDGAARSLACRAAFRLSAHEGLRRSYVIAAPASCSRERDSRSLLLINLAIWSADARSVVCTGNGKAMVVLSACRTAQPGLAHFGAALGVMRAKAASTSRFAAFSTTAMGGHGAVFDAGRGCWLRPD